MNKLPDTDMVGRKFGYLTVTAYAGVRGDFRYWKCECSCGTVSVVRGTGLRGGATKSCGCYRVSQHRRAMITHGMTASPTYNAWQGMIQRCTNKRNDRYNDYGGRGITVCNSWRTFPGFLKDMGIRPQGTTLDRIDNNEGYRPDNCRWATKEQQSWNKRSTVLLQGRKTLKALEKQTGISRHTLYTRLYRGWSLDRVINAPIGG